MKVYLYNPKNGALIKNWFDGADRWTLNVDEVKAFPQGVADKLTEVYSFLRRVSPEDAELHLAKLEESKPAVVKVAPTGELVPKTESEIKADEEVVEVQKKEVKEIVKKIKKAEEAEPEQLPYAEWSRGELISEAHKRKVEIRGLGKSYVSKEQIIMLLENDDAQK